MISIDSDTILDPKTIVEAIARSRGIDLSTIPRPDILLVSASPRIHTYICRALGAEPLSKWVYGRYSRWGISLAIIGGYRVAIARIASIDDINFIEELLSLGISKLIYTSFATGLNIDIGKVVVPYGTICEDGVSENYVPRGIGIAPSTQLLDRVRAVVSDDPELRDVVVFARALSIHSIYRLYTSKIKEFVVRWDCRCIDSKLCAVLALSQYYNKDAIAFLGITETILPYLERAKDETISNICRWITSLITKTITRIQSIAT